MPLNDSRRPINGSHQGSKLSLGHGTQSPSWKPGGVVETESAFRLGELMHAWTDLTVDHITPILSEEDVLKLVP
jgi:hypothetical protein